MNLENFPTSESAKKMLSSVTDGFYERSYVGKWIYQVMGEEMDDAAAKYDELQLQIFPEDATWGIIYHEQKYGIPVNTALPLEERRAEVIRRRDIHSPMNPTRIEEIVKGLTKVEVKVTEDVAPYTFAIDISTNGNTEQLNYSNIVRTVRKVKPSHLSFYAFFSSSVVTNIVIETSAVAKWPLLAGEDYCGMRPVPAFTGELADVNVHAGMDSENYKRYPDLTGTKPDINVPAVLNKPDILSIIESEPIKKMDTMPGESPAGILPNENMAYRSNDLKISSETEGDSIEFSVLIPGAEVAGVYPNSKTVLKSEAATLTGDVSGAGTVVKYKLSGEDTGQAAIINNGVGPKVSGKGLQIIHLMCGEEL